MDISIGGGDSLAQVVTAWAALTAALFGPALGYLAARHQARRMTVSVHRQAWIDGLREDVANLIMSATRLHAAGPHKGALADLKESSLEAIFLLQLQLSRIELRLNPSEPMHKELVISLQKVVDTAVTNANFAGPRTKAMEAASRVLKAEWKVVKRGS